MNPTKGALRLLVVFLVVSLIGLSGLGRSLGEWLGFGFQYARLRSSGGDHFRLANELCELPFGWVVSKPDSAKTVSIARFIDLVREKEVTVVTALVLPEEGYASFVLSAEVARNEGKYVIHELAAPPTLARYAGILKNHQFVLVSTDLDRLREVANMMSGDLCRTK